MYCSGCGEVLQWEKEDRVLYVDAATGESVHNAVLKCPSKMAWKDGHDWFAGTWRESRGFERHSW